MYSGVRSFWKIFLILNVGLILFFCFQGSRELLSQGVPGVLIILGRLMGLLGGFMILLQFFFMGRLPFLESVFGLDTLSRYHQRNGKWGIVLLLLHPLFLTIGYAQLAGVSLWSQYMDFVVNYEDVALAAVGLMLFVVVVITSLMIIRSRLRYETWYFVHLIAYLAVFLSYGHQFAVGPDLLLNRFFYGYWMGLYVVVFGVHVVYRALRPLYLYYRHGFFVSRVVRETPTVTSIYVSGKGMESFSATPGQFMILRFLTKGMWWQGHPFSLSIMPDGKEIRVTVKELGDFTKLLPGLTVGTKVVIDGPYGIFTHRVNTSEKVLMVAGGIGITPVRSLMEDLVNRGKEVTLLYANRSSADIPLRGELNQIAQNPKAKVVHVLSDEPTHEGEKGRIDEEKIRRLAPDFSERDIYICGPVPMMNGLIETLSKMGVSASKIHYEKFAF